MGRKVKFDDSPFVSVESDARSPVLGFGRGRDNEALHVKLQQAFAEPINGEIRQLSVSEERIGRLLARQEYNPYARAVITRASEGRAILGLTRIDRLRTYH